MATIGLKDLYIASITTNAQTGKKTYGTPKRAAKAITADLSVEYAAAELYADDALVDSVNEFVKGELKLNVDDLVPDIAAEILGHTKTTDGIIFAKDTDEAPYIAVGFRARKTGGKYRYLWLYKVKFSEPSEGFQTQQNGREFKTPEITGTFEKREDGYWKADYTGTETDDIGKAWFESVKEPSQSTAN